MPIGCASASYVIQDRDGGIVTASGTLIDVTWARIINDASTAQVVIGVSGENCCAELANVRAWRQWLLIFRNEQQVWSGPIVSVDWSFDRVTVNATDLIGLLDRRVPHQSLSYTDTDLTIIAEDLVEDGLAPDDPGHAVTIVGPALVTGGRSYQQNIGQTADHLRDLADTGIDFTAVGTNIVVLPEDFCDVVGRLSDEDLPEGVTVTEDGAALATRWVVAGADDTSTTGVDIVGTAGGIDPYYGLLEVYVEQTTISTQAAADQAAAARLKVSTTATVIDTQSVTLSPNANVDVLSLVPGWCVVITTSATCRDISQQLKITGLQVSENGGDGDTPGQERIILQVAAAGATGGAV